MTAHRSRRGGRRGAADAVRAGAAVLGELLVTLGVLVLLFAVWQLWWTGLAAGRDARAAAHALQHRWSAAAQPQPAGAGPGGAGPGGAASTGSAGDPPVPAEPSTGTPFAIVHIPRFGTGWQVAAEQGVDVRSVLDHGVLGHYPGTAMPGAPGNVAMAGHRTTYGHPMNQIAELAVGDPIVVETQDTWYVYTVTGHEIVDPSDLAAIAPVPDRPGVAPTDRMLTFTACHPEYSARQRYVVHAAMTSWQPRTAGVPAVLAGG